MLSCKLDYWRRCTCRNVLLVCEGEVGELVQPGGMWGLPSGLLCGTSGTKDLCMVPCCSCHIYGIWTSTSKKVWGCLKLINWGWQCKSTLGGALFIGKAGSHCVILLCFEAFLLVLLVIYCKRFYWILLFTIRLLFNVFEVGKAKSATQNVLMKHWMGYSRKIFKLFTPFPVCFFSL